MRLTQMLAVLNGEVPEHNYHRLSHYDPYLSLDIIEERAAILEYDGGLCRDEAEEQALIEIQQRMEGAA